LDSIEVGIVCLTPENLAAPWLLFEAGALSKKIGEKARLCTYLLGGLGHGDVPQPLGMLQHTRASKEETRKMIDSINRAINPDSPVNLDRLFERMWPDLEKEIKNMPTPEKDVPAERPVRDMVAEILETMRSDAERRKKVDFMDQYIPVFKQLFPALEAYVNQAAQAPTQKQIRSIPWKAWGEPQNKKCPQCGNTEHVTRTENVAYCGKCGIASFNLEPAS
jgi:ribosomal protein S27AE